MAAHRSGPVLVLFVGLVGATALLACSGKGAGTPVKGASDAGISDASPPKLVVRPPPSGLPEMAKMPPPGVVGSKKATVKLDATLGACTGALNAQAKDPSAQLKKLGDVCAASSKMKPVGAVMRGSQSDKDAHQENKFHAESGHCYRVYLATDEAVKEAIVVMRDSAGDIVAESPAPAIPENGAACFTAADDVTLLVGVGSGKGAWSAQVWSD